MNVNLLNRIYESASWRSRHAYQTCRRHVFRFLVSLPLTGTVLYRYRSLAEPRFRSENKVPVVMCTWRRLERLHRTLAMLESQRNVDVKLFIWNNNCLRRKSLDTTIKSYNGIEVEVIHSLYNIGGFGRFYAARQISDKYPSVVFIDDDQNLEEDAISRLWLEREESSISSVWAFNFTDPIEYLNRSPADPGEPATYCGTGGMVCPSWIFEKGALFENCPRKFWFIEDLWLSYFANHCLGLNLRKSKAQIRIEDDGKDQAGRLLSLKDEFLQKLVAEGWDLSPEPSQMRCVDAQHSESDDDLSLK